MSHKVRSLPNHIKYSLYFTAVGIFAALLSMRESSSYGHLFEIIPVLGGTLPFFTLTALFVTIYKLDGGNLKELGWGWPNWKTTKTKTIGLLAVWTIGLMVLRIVESGLLAPLLDQIGPPASSLSRMAPLTGNLELTLALLPFMWLVVIGEELLFRGFILNFLAEKLGGTALSWSIAIVISAALFGLGHFWQGPRGMIATGIGALIMGAAYYLVGRTLWPTIISHALVNTMGFISIYADS